MHASGHALGAGSVRTTSAIPSMMCGFPALQASLENLAKISVAGSATVGERILEIEVRPKGTQGFNRHWRWLRLQTADGRGKRRRFACSVKATAGVCRGTGSLPIPAAEVKAMHFGKRSEFFEHMGRYTNNSKCSGLEKSLDEFERFHVRSCNPKALHFLVRPPWCFAYNKSEWALRYRPKHDRPNRGIAMLQPCPGAVSSGWMGVLVQGPVTESHEATRGRGSISVARHGSPCAQEMPRSSRRLSRTAARQSRIRMLSAGSVQVGVRRCERVSV